MKDFELCLCKKVMRSTLIKLIKTQRLTQLKEVQAESKAGSNCGGCNPEIEELIVIVNKKSNDIL